MAKKLKLKLKYRSKSNSKSKAARHSTLNSRKSIISKSKSIHKILKKCIKYHRKLSRQELIEKQNQVRRFECHQCNFFCFHRPDWNRHGLFHLYQQRARLPCPHCPHTFGQEEILKLHLKTHGNVLSPEMPVLTPEAESLISSQNSESSNSRWEQENFNGCQTTEKDKENNDGKRKSEKEPESEPEFPKKNDSGGSTREIPKVLEMQTKSQEIPSSVQKCKNEETEKIPETSSNRFRGEKIFTESQKTKEISKIPQGPKVSEVSNIPEIPKNAENSQGEIKSEIPPSSKSPQVAVIKRAKHKSPVRSTSKSDKSVEIITIDDSSNDDDESVPKGTLNGKSFYVSRPWEEKVMEESRKANSSHQNQSQSQSQLPIMLNNMSIQISPKTPTKDGNSQVHVEIPIQSQSILPKGLKSPPVLHIPDRCDENQEKSSHSKLKFPDFLHSRRNLAFAPKPTRIATKTATATAQPIQPPQPPTQPPAQSKLFRRKSSEFQFFQTDKTLISGFGSDSGSVVQRRSSCESEKSVPIVFPEFDIDYSLPQPNQNQNHNHSQVESPKRVQNQKPDPAQTTVEIPNPNPNPNPYPSVKMSLLNHLLNRKQIPKENPNIFNGNDHGEKSCDVSISLAESTKSKSKSKSSSPFSHPVFSSVQIPISCIDESFHFHYQHKLQRNNVVQIQNQSKNQSNGSPRKIIEAEFPSQSASGSGTVKGKILNSIAQKLSQSELKLTTPETHTVYVHIHPPFSSTSTPTADGASVQVLNHHNIEKKESAKISVVPLNLLRVQRPSTTTTITTTNSSSGNPLVIKNGTKTRTETRTGAATSNGTGTRSANGNGNGNGNGIGPTQSTLKSKQLPVQIITQNAQHPAFASIPPPLRMSNSGGIVIERSPRKKHRRVGIEDCHLLNMEMDVELDLISASWVACPFCAYRTSIPGQLTAHMMDHTGQYDVPYACGSCEFFCVEREVLKKHRLKNHSTQNQSQIQIQIQGQGQGQDLGQSEAQVRDQEYDEFITIPSASASVSDEGSSEREEENGRPIKCPHPGCNYTARHKNLLKSHIISHIREKPFVCPTCQRSFGRKSHVTRHMRIHEKRTVAAAEALTMLSNSIPIPMPMTMTIPMTSALHNSSNSISKSNTNSNTNSNSSSNSPPFSGFTERPWPVDNTSQMTSANNHISSINNNNNHHHLNGSYDETVNDDDNDNEPVDYSMPGVTSR